MNNLYIFDLDKTILSIDVEYNFLNYLFKKKKINNIEKKKNETFYKNYKKGKLVFSNYLLFITKTIKKKKKFIKFFKKKIKNNIYKKMFSLLKKKKNKIISTSSIFFFSKVIKKIFKTKVLSSGKKRNYKYYKLINISRYLINKKFKKIIFFTDSINDISLINFSNNNIIINPNFFFFKKLYKKKNVNFIFLKSIF
ncbi:hypothetical protein [Candidatus Vidania fulgoroideorum]